MIDTLLNSLDGVRETGKDRWLAKCPAHDDRSPSLSIQNAGDRLLIHCFAGCDALDVVHAIGLELGDLFADRCDYQTKSSRSRIPASDALRAIDHEALVVTVIASDMREKRAIDDEDIQRLTTAAKRIGAARMICAPGITK